jgi:hypothetical protein
MRRPWRKVWRGSYRESRSRKPRPRRMAAPPWTICTGEQLGSPGRPSSPNTAADTCGALRYATNTPSGTRSRFPPSAAAAAASLSSPTVPHSARAVFVVAILAKVRTHLLNSKGRSPSRPYRHVGRANHGGPAAELAESVATTTEVFARSTAASLTCGVSRTVAAVMAGQRGPDVGTISCSGPRS